jgi:glycosyltransferase involved in cell wall biosynthesis
MQPQITFAIPYYQGSDVQLAQTLLRKTIQSVLIQTRAEWTVLICHNGGHNDELDRLVKSYADPRLVLHNNGVNVGAIGNFNVCLDLPTTPLITILHADDQLLPDYTDSILQATTTHPDVSLYYCGAMIIDINDKPVFSLPDYVKRFIEPKEKGKYTLLEGEDALKKILIGNFIFCPTIAYRKAKLDSFRFSNTWTSVQDLEFMARLLVNGHRFLGINTPIVGI